MSYPDSMSSASKVTSSVAKMNLALPRVVAGFARDGGAQCLSHHQNRYIRVRHHFCGLTAEDKSPYATSAMR